MQVWGKITMYCCMKNRGVILCIVWFLPIQSRRKLSWFVICKIKECAGKPKSTLILKYRSFVFLCRSCTSRPLCWCFCWGSSWGRCSSASWGLQRWRYTPGYTSIVFMFWGCVSDTDAVVGWNRLGENLYQLRRPTRILVKRLTIFCIE